MRQSEIFAFDQHIPFEGWTSCPSNVIDEQDRRWYLRSPITVVVGVGLAVI
ncbi:MAG: hypothetical protein V7K88_09905 [Nostoc sp.]|uniref:hypothetical protein n=1 Tax=Nostoc sp. TaxID=1180 RepID=UPI002FF6EF8E